MNLTIVIVLLIAAQLTSADLPIHGLLNDAKGKWIFTATKARTGGLASCGGNVPNMNVENLQSEIENYEAWIQKNEIDKEFELTLTDDKVTANGDVSPRNKWKHLTVVEPSKPSNVIGTWTMVYDEGFEIRHKNRKYFGLFKYSRKNTNDCFPLNGDNENMFGETKCYATDPTKLKIGWFTEEENVGGEIKHKWGCFYARKALNDSVDVSYVVENTNEEPKLLPRKWAKNQNSMHFSWVAQQQGQFRHSTELFRIAKNQNYKKFHSSTMNYRLPEFLQKSKSKLQDHPFACPKQPSLSLLNVKDELPNFWSWGDPFISQTWTANSDNIINQGNCGSCYAVSSAYVLQKRFEILLNKIFPEENKKNFENIKLSPQSILSCSPYNQGCDGGYPFLVGKHAKEFGLPTEECMNYMGTHSSDEAPCRYHIGNVKRSSLYDQVGCNPDERWYAKGYGYVGGCYECSDEESMMYEIFLHGPIVVAIDAPNELFLYQDGIFDSPPSEHGKLCDDPGKNLNGWEYTNHAVVVVGWGEEEHPSRDPIKYWIVRNTWGNDWGKDGYVKIIRGKNFAGIESQAVYVDPDLSRGAAKQYIKKLHKDRKQENVNITE